MRVFPILLALVSLSNLGLGNPGVGKVKEGNRLFNEGKYDQALVKYHEALLEIPDSPKIYFNIGDVEYEKGDYEKAESLFKKLGKIEDLKLLAKFYYNLGNSYYRQENLAESLAAYKKAIELDPEDMDAKFNYEFVRQQLAQKKEEEKEKEQEEKKDDQPPIFLYQDAPDIE
jgi:Ca-activated chloride channel family protein